MTMASWQALALRDALGRSKPVSNREPLPAHITAAVQAACAKAVDSSWELASGTDALRLRLENNILIAAALKIFWLIVSSVRGVRTLSGNIHGVLQAGVSSVSRLNQLTKMRATAAKVATRRNLTAGAVVACACGKTRLSLATRAPRMRLECCCADCRQALEWAASKGGPSAPVVPQWNYFANDIRDVQGLENLKLCQLRHGAYATRAVAKCCYSTLLVDHPAYQENVFAVPGDVCQLLAEERPAQGRIWTKDRDADKENLPPYSGRGPCVRGDEPFWPLRFLPTFSRPVRLPRKGVSVQQLFAQLGSPSVLGLQEGKRFD
eukprot:gnl/TRDRNA2_/TRDRNA2_161961_c1_seq3.p1 gnl/TRDRNA2_/TRDRNA2_161961_c1~~gnl/TRDRNA2_/TRDRNA2_161961_c1_seq3.p1  ORF type:complete len:321 (+),score=30.25 gnl/TRDRNA2_/TRDRNA2_161961_c1_seq3:191-1153(+)